MAYIPPHKRHSGAASSSPFPPPHSVQPRSARNTRKTPATQIIYGDGSISRWFPAGGHLPDSLRLEPFCAQSVDQKSGKKQLFVLGYDRRSGGDEEERPPWVSIAERVDPDLVASVRNVRHMLEMENEGVKIRLVARVGKVLFPGNSKIVLDSIRKAAFGAISPVHKSFNTNLPLEYLEGVKRLIVPKIGFELQSEKEHYQIKVYDKERHGLTISCKCIVTKGGELELKKIEVNDIRHMVVDISCLDKDLDMRLLLVTKRILKDMDDKERSCINELIKSAIMDLDAKGGLRWPLGKESAGQRFEIVGVWHTKQNLFRGQSVILKLRHADRFDYVTSKGGVSNEFTLKLTSISKQLQDGDIESCSLWGMLQEDLKLIWENFLVSNTCLYDSQGDGSTEFSRLQSRGWFNRIF